MGDPAAEQADGETALAATISALQGLASESGLQSPARHAVQDAVRRLHGSNQAALLDAIPDAVTIHDQHGDVLDANLAACRLYGYAHDRLLALNLVDLSPGLPPDHVQHVIETCRISDAFTIETSIRRSDGRSFPVEIHASTWQQGDETRMVSVVRGISHWQRTANALRESENRYNLLLRTIDKGVYVCNASGTVLYVNPAALQMLAVREEEMTQASREGFPDWQWFDESGFLLQHSQLPSSRALASGKPTESMLICVSQPYRREPLWLSMSAVPLLRANEDAPYQVVVAFDDVTELKRMRDVLAQTQSVGGIGGFELTLGNGHLFWTEEMYRLFDISASTPVTLERFLSLLDERDGDTFRNAVATLSQSGESLQYEHGIVTPLGRRRWLNVALRPLVRENMVFGIVGMCQDVSARKQLELELRRKAVTDPLTGLANRDAIVEELNRRIIATREGESGPSLLYIDLDRFKIVNDILGAAAGDALIKAAAERLQASLPPGALCGRFASDEFLVVLPRQLRAEAATELAERIVQQFRRPFRHRDEDYIVTASIGLARHPQDGRNAQMLMRHADAAMSDAKRRGRNDWQAFTLDMERQLEHKLAIESQLRHALERNELHLAWQPQVDLHDGRITGAEALLRWRHPQRGELLPLAFVPYAEASGDIIPIGAWVVQEACRQLRQWRDAGLALPRVAVNIAYRQLLSEGFLDLVAGSLRQNDLPGDALEMEMIERMLIEDTPETLQVLKDLRGLGVRVLIDDFGEGHSSLNYLRRLPIDALKISGEFVRRAPTSAADLAICDAVVRVGQGLGLDLVAEGVETEEQRQLLLQHGVTLAQGNLFCAAIDADGLAACVRERGVADGA